MLKLIACASAIAIAAPAAAQLTGAVDAAAGAAVQTTPATDSLMSPDPVANATGDTPVSVETETALDADAAIAADTPDASADVAVEADAEVDAAASADTTPAADQAEIGNYVATAFPEADVDSNGELSETEFVTWIMPIYAEQSVSASS
ncbi:MAG: hypothetical protein HKN78_01730, partial [Sphingomonadaceae bacterium]|nr:hypothetical protein [Sphingomonadaceae bacterium]